MEARRVGRPSTETVELLGAVDTGVLTVLGNVNSNAHDVVLSEHVLVVTRRVLPLLEKRIRGLHRILRGTVRAPLVAEVLTVVVGDVLTGVGGVSPVELADTQELVVRIVVEVVGIGHVLTPGASIESHRIGDNQLGEPSVGAIDVHLLHDERLDDARLRRIVHLRPVDPIEAPLRRGLTSGSIPDRGIGLVRTRLGGLEGRLRVRQRTSQLGLSGGIGRKGCRLPLGRRSIARQHGIVFVVDAPLGADQGGAEGIVGGTGSLSQGGNDDERRSDRGGRQDNRRVRASELERH